MTDGGVGCLWLGYGRLAGNRWLNVIKSIPVVYGTCLSLSPETVVVAAFHCGAEGGSGLVAVVRSFTFFAGVGTISMCPAVLATGASSRLGFTAVWATASASLVSSTISLVATAVVAIGGWLGIDLCLQELHLLHHGLHLGHEGVVGLCGIGHFVGFGFCCFGCFRFGGMHLGHELLHNAVGIVVAKFVPDGAV